MLRNIADIVNIRKIEGVYIYTKSGEKKVLVEIFDAAQNDVWDTLLMSLDDIECFIVREQCKADDYGEYFSRMLERSFGMPYLPSLLEYIERFQKFIPALATYRRMFLITCHGSQSDASIAFTLGRLGVAHRICQGEEYPLLLTSLYT
jgi:hypothetical protein